MPRVIFMLTENLASRRRGHRL